MPSIKLFRRSTKAPTESSCSIGTKLKESKLAKKASPLNQTLHAKQAQFKANVDKNFNKIGSFVVSKIKRNKSKKLNLDSPLKLNGEATPLFLAPLAPDVTSILTPLAPNKPEKESLSKRLEKEIGSKVHALSVSLNGIVADINNIYEAKQERRWKEEREKKILEEIIEWKGKNQILKKKVLHFEADRCRVRKEAKERDIFFFLFMKVLMPKNRMPKAKDLGGTVRDESCDMMEEGYQAHGGIYDLIQICYPPPVFATLIYILSMFILYLVRLRIT